MLNTSPTTLTMVTGASFLAVFSSSFGISMRFVTKAAPWRSTTARVSCMSRKKSGRSGEEFKTALLLASVLEQCQNAVFECSYTKTICGT